MQSKVIKVFKEPALILELNFGRFLVISDLHLGFESELRERGINIPEKSSELSNNLSSIISKYKIRNLIIAGDLKHKVRGISVLESYVMAKSFLDLFLNLDQVHIVQGNHDGDIFPLLPKKVILHDTKGFMLNDLLISHGHAHVLEEAYEKASTIIIGHLHPAVKLYDSLGYSYIIPVWLEFEIKRPKVIILPSFNRYIGQFVVNNKEKVSLPILERLNISIEDMSAITLDGVNLGKVKDIA